MYRDVKGYEGIFGVSECGKVWSYRTNKELSLVKSKTGYWTLSTKIGGRKGKDVCFKVHRLVAEAYVPNPENKLFVNHKDSNKLNNHYTNLEWVTNSENIKHAYINGAFDTQKVKERNKKQRKLTDEQVEFVKKHYEEFGPRKLGRLFKVSHTTIIDVYKRGYKD